MSRSYTEDPLKVFHFIVEVDGFKRAGFMECNGLQRNTEIAEYREGGNNTTPQKSAGQTSYDNVTFRRGQIVTIPGADDFLQWASDVHEVSGRGVASEYRRDFDIVQMDATGTEVKRWSVVNAFPVRFKPMGDLNALDMSANSVEELEVAIEGFEPV